MLGIFSFGQSLREVKQTDRTQKDVFILGVYASAVHARWIAPEGMKGIKALAVASEPYIFWKGENPKVEIPKIDEELGELEPAGIDFNGPSGRALDECYLKPLRIERKQCWLSDLVPHSCLNIQQKKAIEERYHSLMGKYNIPRATIPDRPTQVLSNDRHDEILEELRTAQPKLVITLGDEPLRWFFARYYSEMISLRETIETPQRYGMVIPCVVKSIRFNLLPLTHPRNAARLGLHSKDWYERHKEWTESAAMSVVEKLF